MPQEKKLETMSAGALAMLLKGMPHNTPVRCELDYGIDMNMSNRCRITGIQLQSDGLWLKVERNY